MAIKAGESVFRLVDPKGTGTKLHAARLKSAFSGGYAARLVDMPPSLVFRIEAGEQLFYGATQAKRLTKLAEQLLVPEAVQFVPASWQEMVAQKSRRKPQPTTSAAPAAASPAPASKAGHGDAVETAKSVLSAHRRGIIPADTALRLLGLVLEVNE